MTVSTLARLPATRDDLWHYAPLDEIAARMERSVVPNGGLVSAVSASLIDAMAGVVWPRLVFVNGFYAAALSNHDALPDGVRCRVSGTHPGGGPAGVTVTVDDGVRIEEPVHVVHVAVPHTSETHSVLARARTRIDVGDRGRLVVVETFGGLDRTTGSTVTDAATTIRLGDRAELVHYRIQIEAPAATHIGHTHIDQGPGSVLRLTSVTLGGEIARNAVEVHLDAPDARTELAAISVTGGRQRHDTVVTVDHAASRCSSSQRFTGVVDDHGRASFSGEIIVEPGTTGTDAHQSSRNLALDPNAEADARPWLRILADDVRCTHGASVGRLDDDALHYLRSRGVPLVAARAMLIDAFVRDVTDSITHEPVRAHVSTLVGAAASNASTHTTLRPVEHP